MNALAPFLGMLKAVAVIAAVLGLFAGGVKVGGDRIQAKWDAAEKSGIAAANAAVLTRIRNNERIAEQQELDRQKLKKGHANEIAQIRAAYAADRGLRISADVCAGLASAAQAESTGGSDAAAARTIALPEPIERYLRELMREADTIVAGCRVAQQFIADNGMAP